MEIKKTYLGVDNTHDEYMLTLHDKSKRIGFCKYYTDITQQTCTITFININKPFRKKGYATDIVKELQKSFSVNWNYNFTNQGRLWYNSLLNKKIIENEICDYECDQETY